MSFRWLTWLTWGGDMGEFLDARGRGRRCADRFAIV
jgi:hypothetical protein